MSTPKLKRIVCGIDGSEVSLQAAVYAARYAEKLRLPLDLVFVRRPLMVPPLEVYSDVMVELERADAAYAEECLTKAAARLALNAPPTLTAVVGTAVEQLIDFAKRSGASMIVVGSRGQGAIKRFMLGSVADGLVQNAPMSVLVFHPPQTAGEATAAKPGSEHLIDR